MTSKLNTSKVIEKEWQGIPGAILCFPVFLALSSAMAAEREQSIALTPQERHDRLLDFRTRTLADILGQAPYLLRIDKMDEVLKEKRDAKAVELEKEGLDAAKIKELIAEVKLTQEEIDDLKEPFPDYPETLPEGKTPAEVYYEYFSQTDDAGRVIFQLLVEDVISEFWIWATPRPTISVSAYTQGK